MNQASECVVIVHGLWMRGVASLPLARHLEKATGLPVYRFDYPSLRGHLDDNSKKLKRYCDELDCDTVHLVGHSLGGVIIVNTLNHYPPDKPGRAVAIGSPLAGTLSGERLGKVPVLKNLLGNSLGVSLKRGPMRYEGEREIGVITATKPRGIARVLGRMEGTHDGIVFAHETALPGAKQHFEMPDQDHTTSYFSAHVAERVAAFLKDGHF